MKYFDKSVIPPSSGLISTLEHEINYFFSNKTPHAFVSFWKPEIHHNHRNISKSKWLWSPVYVYFIVYLCLLVKLFNTATNLRIHIFSWNYVFLTGPIIRNFLTRFLPTILLILIRWNIQTICCSVIFRTFIISAKEGRKNILYIVNIYMFSIILYK